MFTATLSALYYRLLTYLYAFVVPYLCNNQNRPAKIQKLELQMPAGKKTLTFVSEKIIGCSFIVLNTLGVGFLEKVYENALVHELRDAGLMVK